MKHCDWLLTVQHIVLGFFGLVSSVCTAWLVHRRKELDREQNERKRTSGEYLDHRVERTNEKVERSRRRGGP